MSKKQNVEFELLEEFIINNEHRFRIKIRGTNIILNVSADSLEEAVKKALEIIKKLEIKLK